MAKMPDITKAKNSITPIKRISRIPSAYDHRCGILGLKLAQKAVTVITMGGDYTKPTNQGYQRLKDFSQPVAFFKIVISIKLLFVIFFQNYHLEFLGWLDDQINNPDEY